MARVWESRRPDDPVSTRTLGMFSQSVVESGVQTFRVTTGMLTLALITLDCWTTIWCFEGVLFAGDGEVSPPQPGRQRKISSIRLLPAFLRCGRRQILMVPERGCHRREDRETSFGLFSLFFVPGGDPKRE